MSTDTFIRTLAESASDQAKKEQTPGYTFTKSAIADLPSTAVQSIHIENDKPVEVIITIQK